eukprot:Sspe_Gene.75271::Locus_47031_Transcript_1_3_Confidence_0.833_Length_579::g.75271::m.75271
MRIFSSTAPPPSLSLSTPLPNCIFLPFTFQRTTHSQATFSLFAIPRCRGTLSGLRSRPRGRGLFCEEAVSRCQRSATTCYRYTMLFPLLCALRRARGTAELLSSSLPAST